MVDVAKGDRDGKGTAAVGVQGVVGKASSPERESDGGGQPVPERGAAPGQATNPLLCSVGVVPNKSMFGSVPCLFDCAPNHLGPETVAVDSAVGERKNSGRERGEASLSTSIGGNVVGPLRSSEVLFGSGTAPRMGEASTERSKSF